MEVCMCVYVCACVGNVGAGTLKKTCPSFYFEMFFLEKFASLVVRFFSLKWAASDQRERERETQFGVS